MARTTANLAIVFADISGSTRLYETLGDAVARELVSQCLDLMSEQITKYDGTVIKTIGDEIMCTFPTAERATESSMGMQEAITEDLPDMNPNTPSTMTIRIGLHFGSAILEGGDVFGDAVNVAARMAGLAKGGQIITTQQTAEELAPILRSQTRHLDRITVKGQERPHRHLRGHLAARGCHSYRHQRHQERNQIGLAQARLSRQGDASRRNLRHRHPRPG